MSASTQLPSRQPPTGDRFALGHRYVPKIGPDGEEVLQQVPLTPYDVLHPQEGDFIVQTDDHVDEWVYLRTVANWVLADDPEAVVLNDHRIDLGIPDVEPIGSDLAVFLGVKERKHPGGTFYCAEEGVHPNLIAEVTSPETRHNDFGIKKDYYYLAKTAYYVIVDTKHLETKGILALFGYRWAPGDWEVLEPNDKGWLWLEPLKLWLGTVGRQLRFFDSQGKPIGDYTEVAHALRQAERRADEEKRRADEAELKSKELEQRLRDIEEKLRQPPLNGHGPKNGE